jgi:hypothetical protein
VYITVYKHAVIECVNQSTLIALRSCASTGLRGFSAFFCTCMRVRDNVDTRADALRLKDKMKMCRAMAE